MSVSGNRRAFREQEQMREGVTGGMQEFSLEQKLRGEARLRLEGRALTGQEDYRAKLSLEKASWVLSAVVTSNGGVITTTWAVITPRSSRRALRWAGICTWIFRARGRRSG